MKDSSSGVLIRAFDKSDFDKATALWRAMEGIGLTESDTREAIETFLDRNPGFSAVAITERDRMVGAVLCGHNGRSGVLHHLAVLPAHRGKGIAKRLIEHCFARLAEANIPRCNILVYNDNHHGNRFWTRQGWHDPTTWRVMQRMV